MRPANPLKLRPSPATPPRARRGVTLLEMLVAVALLVMMMLVLVSIFQSATGAISTMRSYQALDEELRRLDAVIRNDLAGVTAKMTPPNDPLDGHGYFEYSENALSDAQGEDSDDTLRFTVKAPDGQPFVGRIWIPWSAFGTYQTPIAYNTTSQYAEVIYFLRNHNLYRRVFLISPQVHGHAVVPKAVSNVPSDRSTSFVGFMTSVFPIAYSKLSKYQSSPYNLVIAKLPTSTNGTTPPAPGFLVSWLGLNDISARPSLASASTYMPITNSLNDLTNRQNRRFNPHFANDYVTINPKTGAITPIPDGIPDDVNADGIYDWAPTLYINSVNLGILNERLWPPTAPGLPGPPVPGNIRPLYNADTAAFPYVYPYSTSAYTSNPVLGVTGNPGGPFGSSHSLDPTITPTPQSGRPFFGTVLDPAFNHNPIDIGDSLPLPGTPKAQTWWGFPTWRETLSPNWLDPIKRINDSSASPFFSLPMIPPTASYDSTPHLQAAGLSYSLLMSGSGAYPPPLNGVVNNAQPFNDGAGSLYFAMPPEVGEEDLVATNVRSFDVKALEQNPIIWNAASSSYQPLPAGYYDLGYANLDFTLGYTPPQFLATFAHEGRIPPYPSDFRADPQYPSTRPNLGDPTSSVIRMTRTWDSWSTDYTSVPGMPLYPENGPLNGLASVMPSYPPPYPIPLRGIQIQIRVTDPENQHVKTLTIRQDFTDKL